LSEDILYTIGHSNRELADFLGLLTHYGIQQVIDIRSLPGSKKYPYFGKEALAESLESEGIHYLHCPDLGGRRRVSKESINTGWRHPAFRGYADYMQTDSFKKGITTLMAEARERITAIMCSEAVPWRCHRSMVGDAMLIRGFTVIDIISRTSARPHKLTPWAKIDGLEITYPALEG
jgi:uncharacterized protein (DUF488 family)